MRAAEQGAGEGGFTIIEMVVALTIMALSMMALASAQYGGLKALGAARQRSAFIELGNAYMEQLRSLPASLVGVSDADPDLLNGTAYPSGQHDGLPAVVLPAGPPSPPPAVEQVLTSEVKGIVVPYTVRRWVTRDPASGNDDLRRLEVQIEWSENRTATRDVSLTSVWYPGGLGTDPPANNAPVINSAAATPASGGTSTVFSFTVSAFDPDADGVSVTWQFGDGATASGSTASHQYTAPGTYSVLVEVRDTRGGSESSSFDVAVSSLGNSPPTASFAITSATGGTAPFTLNVSGAASSDPEGDPLTYQWNWGDGTTGSGVNAGHVYNGAGPYDVTLTVTDTGGAASTSAPQTVNVTGGCAITAASFKNPGTNATANDILVTSTNSPKPVSSSFVFTARTNLNCSSVTWSLQTTSATQRYEVTTSTATTSGSEKLWTATNTISNGHRFPLGQLLTGFATSTSASFSFSFNAHV